MKKTTKSKSAEAPKNPRASLSDESKQIFDFIKKSRKGTTAEGIRSVLDIDPAKLSYILSRLKAKGLVAGEGATRAMKYTVAK